MHIDDSLHSDEERFMVLGSNLVSLVHQGAPREAIEQLVERMRHLFAETPGHEKSKEALQQCAEMMLTIRDRFEQHQQREHALNTVIETAKELICARDSETIMQTIARCARTLLQSEMSCILLYDKSSEEFYMRFAEGLTSQQFRDLRFKRDTGICGLVYRNRLPYRSVDYKNDPRFHHDAKIDAAIEDEGAQSLMAVPLIAGADLIGILFLGERYERAYTVWQTVAVSMLATHAALAIENARLFDQTQTMLEHMSEQNLLLLKQAEETQAATEANEKLISLLAKGGDLREICDMTARLLNGHVVVVDEGEQEIGASGAKSAFALQHGAIPQNVIEMYDHKIHAALGESRATGRSVAAFVSNRLACRICAVPGNRGTLGGMIVFTDGEMDALAARIFEKAAAITGIVLLQERSDSLHKSDFSTVFRGLLLSQPQHDLSMLIKHAARNDLDVEAGLHLAVVEVDEKEKGYVFGKLRQTFKGAPILFDEIDNRLVFLSGVKHTQLLRDALNNFFTAHTQGAATGVLSCLIDDPGKFPEVYKATTKCLATLKALGRTGSIFLQHELALYSMLFSTRDDYNDLNAFLSYTLGSLYNGGKQRENQLARTLLAYIDQGHNAAAAARELGIHINTFRQRLETVNSLLGDWNNKHRILEIHVALRLWRLQQNAPEGKPPAS